jgi:hypothetical protein
MTRAQTSILVCAILALVTGCQDGGDQLELTDLDAGERQVVERYVLLERARAVALADPPRGVAILDSLAVAWGDSAGREAEAALPTDPDRAEQLHDLLRRLLEAERDSLVYAPEPRRLTAPLPAPVPPD